MTTTTNEFRSLITPVFVLFCGISLVFLAAMILRDPSRAGAEVMVYSSPRQPADAATSSPRITPTQLTSASAYPELATAEDRLVKNMEFFDSRFERFTADLQVAEEKALSRSDLVGTRYELRSLQDELQRLTGLKTEWVDYHAELLTDTTGQQLAADPELLDDYVQLADRPRLSQRDVEELTERLEPLSHFIAMLEDQDKVPYEPSERLQTRLVSMNKNVTEAVREYDDSLAELRRLMREARSVTAGEETLRDAVYRWRRAQPKTTSQSTPLIPGNYLPEKIETLEPKPATAPAVEPLIPGNYLPEKIEPPEPMPATAHVAVPARPSKPSDFGFGSGTVSHQDGGSASAPTPWESLRKSAQHRPVVHHSNKPAPSNALGTIQPDAHGNFLPSSRVDRPASTSVQTRCRCGPHCACRCRRHTIRHCVTRRH